LAKLPWPPPAATLAGQIPEIGTVEPHTVLWRVHETVGPHVLDWNQLRHFGPVADCRFDPQPPPPGPGNPEGVLYAAVDLPTTLAERFQTHAPPSTAGAVARHWSPGIPPARCSC